DERTQCGAFAFDSGPTPVSALIHAATMVAAGVFLIARVYPLFGGGGTSLGAGSTPALEVVTWVGSITAVFAATIAVAQSDIKRILAYSTVSQLGFMMMGLGMAGVAVGMFHLIAHAFFKALLFLGAGSVIHGCDDEQDVRRLGGLRKYMPVTFVTYAIGMMALSGVPIFFSGFWSKDGILHAAHSWPISQGPFYLGLAGAFLTAFYMTRQVLYVFFGEGRFLLSPAAGSAQSEVEHGGGKGVLSMNLTVAASSPQPSPPEEERERAPRQSGSWLTSGSERYTELPMGRALRVGGSRRNGAPHESPFVMRRPLIILAVFSIVVGFLGTPVWPWFQAFVNGEAVRLDFRRLAEEGVPLVMLLSTLIVFAAVLLGWWLYGRQPLAADRADPLESRWPNLYTLLRRKYFVDEIYEWTVVNFTAWSARTCDWLDRWVVSGAVQLLSWVVVGFSWVDHLVDEYVVNLGFDESCRRFTLGGRLVTRVQNGQVQTYLRVIGIGMVVLVLILIWGCRA
ncbi:MAG TPA: proton-conducting transporter membrane subunit, partial [Verrucomicrobiae bacterium]